MDNFDESIFMLDDMLTRADGSHHLAHVSECVGEWDEANEAVRRLVVHGDSDNEMIADLQKAFIEYFKADDHAEVKEEFDRMMGMYDNPLSQFYTPAIDD